MKKALLLFTLTSALSAFGSKYYSCGNVGGQAENVVEINLETEKAAFFNNDSWSILDLSAMSAPHLYIFRGQDFYFWPMKIDFDEKNLEASVIETENGHKVRMIAEDGCRDICKEDLQSGI